MSYSTPPGGMKRPTARHVSLFQNNRFYGSIFAHSSFSELGGPVGTAPDRSPEDKHVVWEQLQSSGGLLAVLRAKVPGGWLVYASNGYHHHGGITFYPDPEHQWTGETLPID